MIDLLFGVYHCGQGAVNVKSHKINGDFFGIFLPLSGGTTKKWGINRRKRLFAGKTFVRRVRAKRKKEGGNGVRFLLLRGSALHVAAEKSGNGLGQLVLRVACGNAGGGADEQHQPQQVALR